MYICNYKKRPHTSNRQSLNILDQNLTHSTKEASKANSTKSQKTKESFKRLYKTYKRLKKTPKDQRRAPKD